MSGSNFTNCTSNSGTWLRATFSGTSFLSTHNTDPCSWSSTLN
uniref:Uncharacterized protein n=1 Tax=Arundo donax TaxID=35708 RepID=A0A0A8Y7I6_ARUDO